MENYCSGKRLIVFFIHIVLYIKIKNKREIKSYVGRPGCKQYHTQWSKLDEKNKIYNTSHDHSIVANYVTYDWDTYNWYIYFYIFLYQVQSDLNNPSVINKSNYRLKKFFLRSILCYIICYIVINYYILTHGMIIDIQYHFI